MYLYMYMYTMYMYLVIFAVDESQFEAVLSGIHSKSSGLGITVQAVNSCTSH